MNDRLPDILLQPIKDGGAAGDIPDREMLLSGAYVEFGWNP
jgi:hypothetical protein